MSARSAVHRLQWVAVAITIATASCISTSDVVTSDRQVVMRAEREGGFVDQDLDLPIQLEGDLVLEDHTVRAAYCVNGWYWADDVTLDTIVVVATSPRLVRAAELVSAGEFDEVMAVAVEEDLLAFTGGRVEVSELSQDVRDRWSEADLAAYVDATAVQPSTEAIRRFVVYAVSRTTSDQFVYFVDLEHADREAIKRFAEKPDLGSDDILVAGSGTRLAMNSRDCDDLEFP